MGCCCSVPRSLVSKQKIRLKDDTPSGTVDLDLTVIDKHIVCMGFPAEGVESWYRNPYDEVVKYLDHRFGEHYMVYNLCSEPQHVYPPEKFHGRVAHFPFPDHHACPLEMLPKFIEHATAFIAGDERRVVVVHCKAGKGRTGLFACCLLMKLVARLADPDAAMAYYGTARTHNGKGLTIPTQRRYVDYYGRLCRMSNGILPQHIPVIDLKTITLRGVLDKAPMAALEVITKSETTLIYIEEGHDTVPIGRTRHGNDLVLDVSHVPAFSRLAGDIRINGKADPTSKGWVAALSIHTLFMKKGYTASEIDKLYKKDLPQDAGMYFDYLEVMPTADHV